MKFIYIIVLIFISNSIFAKEGENNEVEVINLYESKSLDQMVLENLNEEEEAIKEVNESLNENVEIEINQVEVQQIENVKNNFIYENDIKELTYYFKYLQNIKSQTLQKQIIKVLENLELNLDIEKDKEIFFLIIDYLQSIGQINKSYELVKRYEINNDKNLNFFFGVEFNYLLSTFQLNEVCNLREAINSDVKLDYFFLEKLDIFCLILNIKLI